MEPTIDLYEAIEAVEHYLECGYWRWPDAKELEAIRICLEAAKDKGMV